MLAIIAQLLIDHAEIAVLLSVAIAEQGWLVLTVVKLDKRQTLILSHCRHCRECLAAEADDREL